MLAYTGILYAVLVLINNLITEKWTSDVPKEFANKKNKGLIFDPHTTLRHTTVEFDYTAYTNNLGLRNKEISPVKKDVYRILCFGDSWTYGWGVNNEKAWPQQLENYLHNAGIKKLEVINCGQPGLYSTEYKEHMRRIIPYLKPDLVLTGVLQSDDLAQLFENNSAFTAEDKDEKPVTTTDKIKFAGMSYLNYSFNRLILLFTKNTARVTVYNSKDMKAACHAFINKFDYLQKIRFLSFADTIQTLFKTGHLNPGLLRYYIDFPDMAATFNNPKHPFTKLAAKSLQKDLQEMGAVCKENNCRLIIVNLPYNIFVGHKVIRTPDDCMNMYFENNNKVDSIYRSAAELNNLPYIELTEHFKGLKNKTGYFFLYDGHPNKNGYAEFGNYIGQELIHRNLLYR